MIIPGKEDVKILGKKVPAKELIIVLGCQEKSHMDNDEMGQSCADPDRAIGYWRNMYDISLSNEGRAKARATGQKLWKTFEGKRVVCFSSRMKRAQETAELWMPKDSLIIVEMYMDPPDYNNVHNEVFKKWFEDHNDKAVFDWWNGTDGFWYTWARAKVLQAFMCSGFIHEYYDADVIVLVGHRELMALLMCCMRGANPRKFAGKKYMVQNGEFLKVRITTTGEVKISFPHPNPENP